MGATQNFTDADVARVAHEANRALQLALGEEPSPHWDDAPAWQVDSAIQGVAVARSGDTTDEQMHASWSAHKVADGWVYGPVKDENHKTHPCLIPYDDLPAGQRLKDTLFRSVVAAMSEVS